MHIAHYFFSSAAAVGDTVFLANDAHEVEGGAAATGARAATAAVAVAAAAAAAGVDPDLSDCCLLEGVGFGLGSALPLLGDVGTEDTSPLTGTTADGLPASPAAGAAEAGATATGLGFCTTGLLAFSATIEAAVRLAPPHGVAADDRVDVVVVEEGAGAEEAGTEAGLEEDTASDPSAARGWDFLAARAERLSAPAVAKVVVDAVDGGWGGIPAPEGLAAAAEAERPDFTGIAAPDPPRENA